MFVRAAESVILIVLVVVKVVILIGIPLLEWRLSRCTSPLPGLILPIITFTYALLALFSYVAYDGQPLFAVILDLLVGAIFPR